MEILEREYPIQNTLSDLEKVEIEQENIFQTNSDNYIPISNYFQQIDNWLTSEKPRLLITGNKGCGKSSLVAAWLKHKSTNRKIIYHAVGSNREEEPSEGLVKHIIERITKEYLKEDAKKDFESVYRDMMKDEESPFNFVFQKLKLFLDCFDEAITDKWLIIIDGLDKLETSVGILSELNEDLLSSKIKVLITSIETNIYVRSIKETQTKRYQIIKLDQLTKEDIKKIVIESLKNNGKKLEPCLIEKIKEIPSFTNVQLLRIFIDDLISYGIHEKIGEVIENYCVKNDSEFLMNVISRAEDYYGNKLIRSALILLQINKDGLSEKEITNILGIKPIEWSIINCAIGKFLLRINGRYILNNTMKYIVLSKYRLVIDDTPSDEAKHYAIESIRYLKKTDCDRIRLLFPYFYASEWNHLADTIFDKNVVSQLLVKMSEEEFVQYWIALLKYTTHKPEEYANLDWSDTDSQIVYYLSQIFTQYFNYPGLNILLLKKQIDSLEKLYHTEKQDIHQIGTNLAMHYLSVANWCYEEDEIYDMELFLSKASDIFNEAMIQIPAKYYLISGRLHKAKGNYTTALRLLKRAWKKRKEEIYQGEYPIQETTPIDYLTSLGQLYITIRDYSGLTKCYKAAISFLHKACFPDMIPFQLGNLFRALGEWHIVANDYDNAEIYIKKAIECHKNKIHIVSNNYNSELSRDFQTISLININNNKICDSVQLMEEVLNYERKAHPDSIKLARALLSMAKLKKALKYDNEVTDLIKEAQNLLKKWDIANQEVIPLNRFIFEIVVKDNPTTAKEMVSKFIEDYTQHEYLSISLCCILHLWLAESHDALGEKGECKRNVDIAKKLYKTANKETKLRIKILTLQHCKYPGIRSRKEQIIDKITRRLFPGRKPF